MREIEELFILLRKQKTGLKEGSIILELEEQNSIITIINNMYESRYNAGYVACAKEFGDIKNE